jgi:hypothetical protein
LNNVTGGFDKEIMTKTGKRLTIAFGAVSLDRSWDCEHVHGLTIASREVPVGARDGKPATRVGKVFEVVANEPGTYELHFRLAPVWGGEAERYKSYKITATAPQPE